MRTRLSLVVLALALATVLAWPAGASAQTPSLKLAGAGGAVKLPRFNGGMVPLDLSAWVAATGGDFELRVARPDYDSPIDITQVDPVTGAVLRDLPEDVLNEWFGLSGFIRVSARNAQGAWAGGGLFSFCPNTWERQRIDDSGPELPRYPTSCAAFSPFSKGMVWGVDSGWATHAFGSEFDSPFIRLKREGTYTITIQITRQYIDLLQIPEADARLTFTATVKNRRGGFGEGKGRGMAARPASAQRALTAAPDVAAPDPDTLPDLVALPPWSMGTSTRRGRDYLEFASTPWNAGPAPLVVEGFRRPGEEVMDAYQYFRDATGAVVGKSLVGDMRFHPNPAHNHWHFLQFAAFTLHDAQDLEVVRSRKQAFCLAPTDPIDITVDRADWSPFDGIGTQCGARSALWVREVLQAGWGDTYFQSVPGQSWDITTLPNGWYYAQVEVNPLGTLFEADMANNVESRLIHLGGRPRARRVTVTPWHGIEG
jgi:Lysyl oxidase